MDLCVQSCLFACPSICFEWQNFNVEHYLQSFILSIKLLIPAMPIGACTVDFCHNIIIPLSLTLTWGNKISAKQTCWLPFLAHLSVCQDKIFDRVWIQFKMNILILFSSEILKLKGNYYCFADSIKSFSIGMHSDICKPTWLKLGMILLNCTF